MTALRDTSWIERQYKDLRYAPESVAQCLDLYLPNDGAPPYPVIVAIHGGGFVFGDKQEDQLNAPVAAVAEGFAVAAINYRMRDEAVFPAAVRDAKAAVRYLRGHAARFGLDADRFAAWGNSAGGYFAVMLGVTADSSEFDDPDGAELVSARVQAVVDWFGPVDFLAIDAQFTRSGKAPANRSGPDSVESQFLGVALAKADPDLLRRANPLTYLVPGMPPFLIQHGAEDDVVPVEQSLLLAERLRPFLEPRDLRLNILAGVQHGGPAFETPENMARVFKFLKIHLAQEKMR